MGFVHSGISKLEILRKQRGLTAAELAKQAGVSRGLVSQVERGHRHPSPDLKRRLAAALGASVEELFPASATPALLTAGGTVETGYDDSAVVAGGRAAPTSGTWEGRTRHDEQ